MQARRPEEAAVPQIENNAPNSGALNIAPSASNIPSLKMPVGASSARVAHMPGAQSDAGPAPSIANAAPANSDTALGLARSGLRRVIGENAFGRRRVRAAAGRSRACRKIPAMPEQLRQFQAPIPAAIQACGGSFRFPRIPRRLRRKVEIPKGNLSAKLSASVPEERKRAFPGGAANGGTPNGQGNNGGGLNATGGTGTPAGGTGAGAGSGGNGKSGPPGVSITSTQPGATSPMGGTGATAACGPISRCSRSRSPIRR